MSTPTPPAPGRAEGLLPCPFCGGEAALFEHIGPPRHNYWFVNCLACDSDGAGKKDEAEAIAAWNRRPAPGRAEAPYVSPRELEVLQYAIQLAEREELYAQAMALGDLLQRLTTYRRPAPAIVAEVGDEVRRDVAINFHLQDVVVLASDYDAALRTLAEVREADAKRYNELYDLWQADNHRLGAATQRAEQAERERDAAREALEGLAERPNGYHDCSDYERGYGDAWAAKANMARAALKNLETARHENLETASAPLPAPATKCATCNDLKGWTEQGGYWMPCPDCAPATNATGDATAHIHGIKS